MKNHIRDLADNKYVRPFILVPYVLVKRAVPILFFAVLLGVGAYLIDKARVQAAPGKDFVDYYTFNVPPSRQGDDVYFKVCRRHQENYRYTGALTVYVFRTDVEKGERVKAFARDIKGSIRGECENKVLKAEDYEHKPGTYQMAFCVGFRVQYNIEKTVCKESNIYKVYAQPDDIQSKLDFYEKQIEILRRQLSDSDAVGSGNPTASGEDMTASNQSVASSEQERQTTAPATPREEEPQYREVCDVKETVLFVPVRLNCRQEQV